MPLHTCSLQTARLATESSLGFDVTDRPIFGIVVTYGQILFANSQWHRERILSWDDSSAGPDLAFPVNILSIADLEQFVLVVASTALTARQLIERKEAEEYLERGDWTTYLPSLLRDHREIYLDLDVARRDMEELFRLTMGDDRYEEMMDKPESEE